MSDQAVLLPKWSPDWGTILPKYVQLGHSLYTFWTIGPVSNDWYLTKIIFRSCPFAKMILPWQNHVGKRTAWSLIYFLNYAWLEIWPSVLFFCSPSIILIQQILNWLHVDSLQIDRFLTNNYSQKYTYFMNNRGWTKKKYTGPNF